MGFRSPPLWGGKHRPSSHNYSDSWPETACSQTQHVLLHTGLLLSPSKALKPLWAAGTSRRQRNERKAECRGNQVKKGNGYGTGSGNHQGQHSPNLCLLLPKEEVREAV